MANRSASVAPINDDDQWRVTAYLIAISPTLQKTAQLERQQDQTYTNTRLAIHTAQHKKENYDPALAHELFEVLCSQCHDLADVDALPPETDQEVRKLMERMIDNGLEANEQELTQLIYYLSERYVD